nr:hypothetical protein [uncultured Halomonas sp.]
MAEHVSAGYFVSHPALLTTARHLALFDSPTPATGTVWIFPVALWAVRLWLGSAWGPGVA